MTEQMSNRMRWLALVVLCVGDLMIIVDTTIVNVALPSIRSDLAFSQTSLAWVINAYMLTFGGLLLLAGRLGDLVGHRRMFLLGVTAFTIASLVCGLSTTKGMLIAARAMQGVGGAVISAVAFSLIVVLFTEPSERAKAMGIFGFVLAGGGSIGVLAGGVLTDLVGWHWIFLVNLPIGIGVLASGIRLLPSTHVRPADTSLDLPGAAAITLALVLAVYAIVNGNQAGWTSSQTLGLLGGSLLVVLAFLAWEARTEQPLVPLGIFRHRNLRIASLLGILWTAAMFAVFFLSALYLQFVLHYSPLKVGLTFLPSNVIMMAFSMWLSAKIVLRFGFAKPLAFGLFLISLALVWFARVPVHGHFLPDILPAMLLLGGGAGLALNPLLTAAMSDTPPQDAGLASGITNTAIMMGGALGLAILASAAAAHTHALAVSGHPHPAALTGGYHLAFLIGALFALVAAALGAVFLRVPTAENDLTNSDLAIEAA